MNKRERVIAAIKGEKTDHIPTGFSLHFSEEEKFGQSSVRAHIRFFQETDTDIIKIMNENQVPDMGQIHCAEQFSQYREMSMEDDFMKDQIAMTKAILREADPEAFSLGTLHGIVASMIHPLEKAGRSSIDSRFFLRDSLRKNPESVLSAMNKVADVMCQLAKAYIDCGLDGVYYAALGGEKRIFTDEEHARWIKPFDLRIMKAIRDAGGFCFLHICKDELNMERFAEYGAYADVVNWGIYEAPYTLEEGKKLFPDKTLMGGFANRTGILVDGDLNEIKIATKEILHKYGDRKFILGADCTLPTNIAPERVKAVVDACREA